MSEEFYQKTGKMLNVEEGIEISHLRSGCGTGLSLVSTSIAIDKYQSSKGTAL